MIRDQIKQLSVGLPPGTRLIAVSKTHTADKIMEAYEAGQRDFGENKVQELVAKYEALPKDIRWHMIGHLQSNKVKYIAPFVHLIHGVDSVKLLQEIDKQGQKIGRKIPCLLQFHIAQEESKFGFSKEEVNALLSSTKLADLRHIQLCGVMGMATFTEKSVQIRREFQELASIFKALKQDHFSSVESFQEISMGMSDDYPIAVEEGSTIIRVGSKIFGERL
ncbi:MAG: YggS family pyridoxal phosphate-dependent enzyme [Bacteroidetes bacterium]|nr:YggS family pyridoxal phosphate-dependent enzyme [Bacteroidota bacterium]MBM3424825.1 YggS family pyridoxal phosphate-dependent enzyme [Bacteroidota bacterium]